MNRLRLIKQTLMLEDELDAAYELLTTTTRMIDTRRCSSRARAESLACLRCEGVAWRATCLSGYNRLTVEQPIRRISPKCVVVDGALDK